MLAASFMHVLAPFGRRPSFFVASGTDAYASDNRPKGPTVNSQGRQPLEAFVENDLSPNGATEFLSPRWGLKTLFGTYSRG
jgi:hypothetical protein